MFWSSAAANFSARKRARYFAIALYCSLRRFFSVHALEQVIVRGLASIRAAGISLPQWATTHIFAMLVMLHYAGLSGQCINWSKIRAIRA